MPLLGVTDTDRRLIVERIGKAQKFDFGDLHLERRDEDGAWDLPRLTPDEMGFWHDGLIPLPFPLCWYEFVLNRFRSGLLVREEGSKWLIERIDFVQDTIGYDAVYVSIDRAAPLDDLSVTLAGNYTFIQQMAKSKLYIESHLASSAPLMLYLTLMLNSRSTETRRETASSALQQAQRRRGATPLPDHLIVRIVPEHYQYEHDPATGRKRRSPRLHWRRSHLRHYDREVPSAKFAPTAVHEGREGWWLAVIPRALVGLAEQGEVSHEYRIDSTVKEGV